jgi:hypothetical protein
LVEKNKVSTVNSRTTTTLGAFGITVNSGSAVTSQNNFVWDILNNAAGTSGFGTSFSPFGIRLSAGNNHKVYHNSMNMFGTIPGTAAAISSAAFAIVANTQTGIDVRNNIFANTLTGGLASGSVHVSIFLPSSGTSTMALTINNNDYFSGTTSGQSGIAQVGTTYTATPAGPPTYAGFYTAANFNAADTTNTLNLRTYTSTLGNTSNDNASKVVDPQFVSNTDLHIAAGSPLVDMGASVGVAQDIDSQNRVGIPDIGADEPGGVTPPANAIAATAIITPAPNSFVGNGTSVAPQASFTNAGTATQTNVMVQFTITGPGGYNYTDTQTIATIAPNQTVTVTFAATPVFTTGGTYTATATVLTADANTANDTTSATFMVFAPITGGSVNVGTGEAYTSLTNPGGVFDAINQATVSSNITVNITTDLTAETGAISLNQFASGFTVTIQPSSGARLVSGSNATALINLNGSSCQILWK